MRPTTTSGASSSTAARLPILTGIIVFFASAAAFFSNLRFGNAVMSVGFQDDFYYYAVVARNLALHGRSTFDGIHLTNGYHPLWLAILTAVSWLFSPGGILHCTTPRPFAIALESIQLLIVMLTAHWVFRLARLRCGVAIACAIQLLAAASAIALAGTGMEVVLTIVLAFALLWFRLRPAFQWSAPSAFLYGSIGALMILSRLDSGLLVALLFILDVLPSRLPLKERIRNSVAFLLALWPVAAYLAVNQAIFGIMLPVSGMAKQLRFHHVPSVAAIRSFEEALFNSKIPINQLFVVLTFTAVILLVVRPHTAHQNEPDRTISGVLLSTMLFPPLHLLSVATLSDWPVWAWYVYPWVVSGAIAATLHMPQRLPSGIVLPYRLSFACFAVAFVAFSARIVTLIRYSTPQDALIYLAAEQIRGFAQTHPGIYAMGDRAGAVGYLAGVPVIQLEGLMMDKDFLDNIRQQRDLQEVMHRYQIDFYVSTGALRDSAGCYLVREPRLAGPDSPSMQTRLCQAPVAEFQHWIVINDVFDLHQPAARPSQR